MDVEFYQVCPVCAAARPATAGACNHAIVEWRHAGPVPPMPRPRFRGPFALLFGGSLVAGGLGSMLGLLAS